MPNLWDGAHYSHFGHCLTLGTVAGM
jgi:hypothetical protein